MELASQIDTLSAHTQLMANAAMGSRMVDLALNAIEIIDRNLYERTCDVRWWATDSAVVDCAADLTAESVAYASKRLGVILNAYTVHLDLWLCDLHGNVIANGRPERYSVKDLNVSHEPWFVQATRLHSGDEYAVGDITECAGLRGAEVATYAASVRAGGDDERRPHHRLEIPFDWAPHGALAIHFAWAPQAQTIVRGPGGCRGSRPMPTRARCAPKGRIIASSQESR